MSVTRASFLVRFAEFTNADDALVDAVIAEAAARTPERTWGAKADAGVMYLAAHLLACSPYAAQLKLTAKDGTTWYGRERTRLEGIVGSGFRVTG